jgi:hypothetical protein
VGVFACGPTSRATQWSFAGASRICPRQGGQHRKCLLLGGGVMPQEITAFVSCSFDENDRKQVVKPLVDLIRKCGVDPRPLDQMPEQGHLTDVIVRSIKRHRLFVAIVTKRDMTSHSTISSPRRKRKSPGSSLANGVLRTSPLIIQEIGIACAFEKPMVVFRERGVDPEELGLARGVSEVEFERGTLCEQLKKRSELRDRMETLVGSARRHCLDTSHIIDTLDVIVGGDEVARRSRGERTMKVRQLTDAERWMNEATFLQGLRFLHEQILEEVNEFRPDVFVGINATGVMIAAYLNARLCGKAARPVGMVTTGTYKGKLKRSTDHTVPYARIEEHHDVLVVDSQFKSGRNSCNVIGEIKKEVEGRFCPKRSRGTTFKAGETGKTPPAEHQKRAFQLRRADRMFHRRRARLRWRESFPSF